jgi:hypothetical protein
MKLINPLTDQIIELSIKEELKNMNNKDPDILKNKNVIIEELTKKLKM